MEQPNEAVSEVVDTCGTRLGRAREQAGITLEEASTRLKMPVRVVRSLENDEWRSDPNIFVRGQLRSYARMLGVDIEQELIQSGVNEVVPAELISHTHTPKYRRLFEQAARRGVYIAITAVIVVPVWLATRPHLASLPEVQSLEVPAIVSSPPNSGNQPSAVRERTPLIASMATIRAPASSPEPPGLSLDFTADSWLQVSTPDGEVLEQAVLGKGETRRFNARDGAVIVIGNTAAIEASQNGNPVDLDAFSRANVARFKLSSDGSLAPTTD